MGFVPTPLHHVHVESGLVTSFFLVAVETIFLLVVDFIMQNDIAGGRVYPVPEVVNAQARGQAHKENVLSDISCSSMSEDSLSPGGDSVNGSNHHGRGSKYTQLSGPLVKQLLASLDSVLCNCNEVIWRGDQAIPDATRVIELLKEHWKRVFFITSNSTKP